MTLRLFIHPFIVFKCLIQRNEEESSTDQYTDDLRALEKAKNIIESMTRVLFTIRSRKANSPVAMV